MHISKKFSSTSFLSFASLGIVAAGAVLGACTSEPAETPPTAGSSSPTDSTSGGDPNAGGGGGGGAPVANDATSDDTGIANAGTPRSLGSVSNVAVGDGGGPCAPGATCKTMTVSCPNLPDAQAVVALREPSGIPKGTIYVHGGGGGDDFYSLNVSELVAAGFRTVQVRWPGQWQLTPKDGMKAAACRPATVMKWAYDEIHKGDTSTGFCAEGHSGGSGVIGYALAHYGAETYLDYASLLAGPPFARLDYGCAPATYSGPPTALCPELANAPIALPSKVNPWENTTTCASDTPSSTEITKWAADSVVSPGADYNHPNTPVDFFDCATNPNGTTGGAFFYSQAIESTHAVHCYTDCNGEAIGTTGGKAQYDAMIAQCKPHP